MATFAQAQGDARFTGTVLDPSGAVVAGATVTVKNERTGAVKTAVTDAKGHYVVAGLQPSLYTIAVKQGAFAPLEYTNMPLAVAQEMALDLNLQAAGVTETVTVVGNAATLDLSSARIGVNVSEREVQTLPVNGRQMSQLMLQAPGSQNSGTGTWGEVRFSGRAVEQNVIKFDGVDGSGIIDAAPGVANGENNTPFKLQASLENVQEFRVESSSYPAEFGSGTGGQVSVISKSGANNFHGTVFEYARRDSMDSKNYFDDLRLVDGSIQSEGPKSPLTLNQFGGSVGGPLAKDRAFFFGSYEGYRLDAGLNFVEAVPSDAAWSRAVPAVAALRPGFLASSAKIIPGGSTNPDFDIAQNQALEHVKENSYSGRLDFKVNNNWSSYVRVFRDAGTDDAPQGVTGRRFVTTIDPTNAVFNLQGLLGPGTINEFKFGYNGADSTEVGQTSPLFTGIAMSLSGSVANTGVAGQGGNSAIASPGGLVRVNSAGNGRSAPYSPYSLTFADTVSRTMGNHFVKAGVDYRAIRMAFDQQGGITYTYANITNFLANTPSSIQYFGDLSEPSIFHNGATGEKHTQQAYYVGFAQDEWKVRSDLTLNFGVRYDYYTPLKETDNRIVKFNIDTGRLDPDTTPLYTSSKANFQPRLSATWAANDKTVLKGGFGVFVGPGQTEDQIQPVEAERYSTTLTSGQFLAYPIDPNIIRANFTNNPNNRSYQPRAYSNDYDIPEKVYQYTASMQREFGHGFGATAAYLGSQGRNLFLRSVANRTVFAQTNGASAAIQVREFDIVTCGDGRVLDGTQTPLTATTTCAGSTVASKQSPYAEIDYKTSGGRDSYNAMQLAVTRRAAAGISMNAQYTYGISKGTSGGSNEARTVGNNARELQDYEYDYGYNNFDLRHSFNASLIYTTKSQNAFLDGWSIGGIANARSGLPVNVTIARNDIVYVDGAGVVWNSAAADRTAVINTPGGGASRSTRRPDVIPGVDLFVKDGGKLFLNPAAFATPAPGTFGNMERNAIKGPLFRQVDLVVAKKIGLGATRNMELRAEVFNLLDTVNFDFATLSATLPNALPASGESPAAANRVQPGQAYSAASAGTFGQVTSTVGRSVGLGTPRQVQLALRFSF
jgi:hypothetical protein